LCCKGVFTVQEDLQRREHLVKGGIPSHQASLQKVSRNQFGPTPTPPKPVHKPEEAGCATTVWKTVLKRGLQEKEV